jgi:uncharacterized protein (DUF1330 family)
MNGRCKIALAVIAGAALGAAAMQGLHAQSKPKAYIVTENEVIDAAAQAALFPLNVAAQRAAGGRPLGTAGGRIVAFAGDPPKRVGISEWDSLDQAVAFRNSAAWRDLAPQRAKAVKTVRSYAVEATR